MKPSKVVSAAAILVSAGCSYGSVGVEPCNQELGECTAQSLEEDPLVHPPPARGPYEIDRLPMQPMTELAPTWIRNLPGHLFPIGTGTSAWYFRVLQQNADGSLALHYQNDDDNTIYSTRLDDEGKPQESVGLAAPDGWTVTDAIVGFSACNSVVCINEPVPGLKVNWNNDATDDTCQGETCILLQKIIYAPDVYATPLREELPMGAIDDAVKDSYGNLYRFRSDGDAHSVTKLDAQTGLASWTHTELPDPSWFGQGGGPYRLAVAGVPLDDGRVAVLSIVTDQGLTGHPTLSFIAPTGELSWTALQPYESRPYMLNAKDRLVWVAQSQGDLQVLYKPDVGSAAGVQFLRDDYTNLRPEAAAVDPSGNVYVGLHSGSRLSSKPTLCRVSPDRTGTCYTLPQKVSLGRDESWRFDAIVARDDGNLFIHSGSQLVRLKYPD